MKEHSIEKWQHNHNYNINNEKASRATKNVIIITLITMVAEIIAGIKFGSMALLADGWHMGTHAAALCITLFAYYYATKHEATNKYTFGTGKVGILGGYTSAIVLALVSFIMIIQSIMRIMNPESIQFNYALIVAVIGLIVNGFCTLLLHDNHSHDHGHGSDHSHHHEDHNLKAAYYHVLADALTSVTAIFALILGKYYGWVILDPVMGIVGGLVIAVWAWGLLKSSGTILLDGGVNVDLIKNITSAIEEVPDTKVSDIHVWRLNAQDLSVIISVVTHCNQDLVLYKEKLKSFNQIKHINIEVNKCDLKECIS